MLDESGCFFCLKFVGFVCTDGQHRIVTDLGQDICPIFEAMQRKGVIVRPLMGYAMPSWLRMSYGTREENARFLKVLEEVR